MQVIRCLILIGIYLICHRCDADLLQRLPLEERLQTYQLNNGMTALIQENALPVGKGSFRMAIKRSLHEDVLFSFDGSLKQPELIDQFFMFCREHLQKLSPDQYGIGKNKHALAVVGDPLKSGITAENVAIIAVGDFNSQHIIDWIKSYFDFLPLNPTPLNYIHPIYIEKSSIPTGVALHIDYRIPPIPLLTYVDVKKNWVQIMAQNLLQQRLERSTRFLEENWVHPYPQLIHPVSGFALATEEEYGNVLSFLLWEIEQVKLEGFNENEFLAIKERVRYQLDYLNAQIPYSDSALMATFYADGIFLNEQRLAYAPFIRESQKVISELHFSDLKMAIQQLLQESNRSIHIQCPKNENFPVLTIPEIKDILDKVVGLSEFKAGSLYQENDVMLLDHSMTRKERPVRGLRGAEQMESIHNPFASVQDEDGASSEEDLFSALPLSHEEQETIAFIISHLASKNIFELAFDKKKMEEKGKRIHHVHPLRFIGHIFADEDLKRALKKVKKSSFKWDAFIDGFVKRMKEENGKNNLLLYVSGFAREVNANEDKIIYYIQKKDWEGLVYYLM